MNSITITGHLGRDPEKFSYGGDKRGARFSLAVNRPRKREGEPDADWFDISCFGQDADFVMGYLQKGAHVAVVGPVELNTYAKKDGSGQGASMRVAASRVEGLGKLADGDGKQAAPKQQAAKPPAQAKPDIDWTMDESEDPFEDQ